MFPYCCLLIICIMLFPCSVFKVHLSLFAQGSSRFSRALHSTNNLSFSILHSCIMHEQSWWAKVDSNHRPHDYQSCALASWAIGPSLWPSGLFKWWRLAGSNRWPPACKAGALPAELNPHIQSSLLSLPLHRDIPSKLNNELHDILNYWP